MGCCGSKSAEAALDQQQQQQPGSTEKGRSTAEVVALIGTRRDFDKKFQAAGKDTVCGQGGFCKVFIVWCRTNDGPGQSKEKLAKPLTASSPLLQKQTKDTVLTSGTSVAVKVFDTRRTITKDLFYHEVGVMMRLQDAKVADHAAAGDEPVGPSYAGNYIVDFFGGFHDPRKNRSLLVMEHCTGGELFDRIAEHDFFSESVAARYLKMAARALQFCHAHNIVHGDVKPENFIFVTEDQRSPLKLIDFGLAVADGTVSLAGGRTSDAIVGTPEYLAPEVVNGPVYSKSNDIWSLGVLLYIMLAGTFPFFGKKKADLFQRISKGNIKLVGCPWDTISNECIDLLKKMLQVDPTKRIGLREVLLHRWIHHRAASVVALPKQSRDRLRQFRLKAKFRAAVRTIGVGGNLLRHTRNRRSKSSPELPQDTGAGKQSDEESPKVTCAAGFDQHTCNNPLHVQQVQQSLSAMLPTPLDQGSLMTIFKSLWEHVVDKENASINMALFKTALKTCRHGCVDPSKYSEPCMFSEEAATKLYDLLDSDGDGRITAEEIVTTLSHCTQARSSHLEFCFRLFDRDDSGFLEPTEFAAMITALTRSAQLSDPTGHSMAADINDAFAMGLDDFKISSDGKLHQEEFLAAMDRNPDLYQMLLPPSERRASRLSVDFPS